MRGATSQGLKEIAQLGPVTSYQDTGLSNGLTYYYAVVAVNGAGRGAATQAISAKPVKPLFPPGTPPWYSQFSVTAANLLNAAIKGDKSVKDALTELATKTADIQSGQ